MILCSYYRKDLTTEEAIELGKRAIVHATHRDAYSGGINNGKLTLTHYYSVVLILVVHNSVPRGREWMDESLV